ncbi:Ger(x)C family spore germination C-terminal domain-containing protein [Paenibacillus mesophilus]|uniref:Ger(x)C family spore germination C-terminal domain-containing protein n=1 Tax=Paenibacillus mesophilus TaxID=2582849 RepID=UPI003083166C
MDIFGFGEVFHRTEPKAWKKVRENWDAQFADLPVNVNVDIRIRRLGTINNSFLEELKN